MSVNPDITDLTHEQVIAMFTQLSAECDEAIANGDDPVPIGPIDGVPRCNVGCINTLFPDDPEEQCAECLVGYNGFPVKS